MTNISYLESPALENDRLNRLFESAWPNHSWRDFEPILRQSLLYVGAFDGAGQLVGFANVAWDGGEHAFLLDVTVHSNLQRRGIGIDLVHRATEAARRRGMNWLHVDYEPHLKRFYERCGFRPTDAGLIKTPAAAAA